MTLSGWWLGTSRYDFANLKWRKICYSRFAAEGQEGTSQAKTGVIGDN